MMTSQTHPNAIVAETLANAGIPIFPCDQNKRPRTANGFKDACADASFWEKDPTALVGIPTTSFWVLDLDTPLRIAIAALETATGMTQAEIEACCGLIVETPSGGRHLYWKRAEGMAIRNAAGDIGQGIDTRGHKADGDPSGYVIAPGCVLPDSGSYKIVSGSLETLTPPPHALLKLAVFSVSEREFIESDRNLANVLSQADPTEWRHIHEAHRAAIRPPRETVLTDETAGPMRRQALADLEEKAQPLAGLDDGRRDAIFKGACSVAAYVAHDVLSEAEVEDALLEAWIASGADQKNGMQYAEGAVRRGLEFGANDPLPSLARRFLDESGGQSSFDSTETDVPDDCEAAADPLEGLVERTRTDPTAPMEPETLKRLASLRDDDPSAFETLRSELKKAGCRVAALDKAIPKKSGGQVLPQSQPRLADMAIKLSRSATLFHTADNIGFADVTINGHRQTLPIRGGDFKRYLAGRLYEVMGRAPSTETLHAAINVISAKAQFDGPEETVYLRVANLNDQIYIDRGDKTRSVFAIGATGWSVAHDPPVHFRRPPGMKSLPEAVPGGSIDLLRPFLNIQSDADFQLVIAWALAVLRGRGPYPLLVLSGEQGSAKSTCAQILLALLDPRSPSLLSFPTSEHELFIAANNAHLLAFDNLSGLSQKLSDALCRIATGGGFVKRKLFTDQDQSLIDVKRALILNGIEEIVTRPDLADRAILIALEPISDDRRRPETELWADFEKRRPQILGALLTAVSEGLRRQDETHLDHYSRMADFELWATACQPALWPAGTFREAYRRNREEAVYKMIEASPVASAIRGIMMKMRRTERTERTVWTGTATNLFGEVIGELEAEFPFGNRTPRSWPDSPESLGRLLRRVKPILRKIGIEVEFSKIGKESRRTITIIAFPNSTPPE